jgi:CheY-like chemotaxis protein
MAGEVGQPVPLLLVNVRPSTCAAISHIVTGSLGGQVFRPPTEDGRIDLAGMELTRTAVAQAAEEGKVLWALLEAGGSGAGLAAARQLRSRWNASQLQIALLGGKPELDSSQGLAVGARLTQPVGVDELRSLLCNSLRAREDSALRPPETARQGLRILLAEDNKVNQVFCASLLEKCGHQVIVASNGAEAVERHAQDSFDLIFMDVQMPVMGGYDATASIREAERSRNKHTPIIALTAHAMSGDRQRCLEAGMDGYLSKPVARQELLKEIERVLRPKLAGGTRIRRRS